MKKTIILLVIAVALTMAALMPSLAFAAPYDTETVGPESELVPTQTAYEPVGKIAFADSAIGALNNPEDMALDGDVVYFADSGNKRVVKSDVKGNVLAVIGQGILNNPTGVAVDENLYVCDKADKKVYVFDKQTGTLLRQIDKPSGPLVGDTPFVPLKIATDGRSNLYLVSEGCVSGLMQLSYDGEFLGFVGSNETQASLTSALKNLFFSKEQKSIFLASPRSPTNVSINRRGLLYTVTESAVTNSVKKLNTLGNTIMSPSINYANTVAVAVDDSENIFSVRRDGKIAVFDSYGDLLFSFGSQSSEERLGCLSNPVAIDVTSGGDIVVLDKNYGMAVRYERTKFASLVFKAVEYYKDGLYLEGESSWQEVLRYNSRFIVSYKALARANMKKGNYDLALEQFRLAEDKDGYSEAYWQIRNDWLQNNLIWVVCVVLGIVALVVATKIVYAKKPSLFAPVMQKTAFVTQSRPYRHFVHLFRFCSKPSDAVFEVKYHDGASVWSASALYVWFVVLQILGVAVTGYLFNSSSVYQADGWKIVLTTVGCFALLVVCNYFVSTVTDGEGKLWQCFVTFIYALAPYLVMALPVFIVSNWLTYNETVVYSVCNVVMYAWSAVCLFRAIMELHDYTVWQTVKNIFLTVFAFAMAILFAIVLRMLLAQFFGYFVQIGEELFNNVF